MIINIDLKSKKLVEIGERKILLPENVCLQFTSSVYRLGTLIVSVSNGNEVKKYKATGEPIDITPLCKQAGEVKIEVSHVIDCTPVQTWHVESLLLCEINHELQAIPEIEALKAEIEKMKAALRELAQLVKDNSIT